MYLVVIALFGLVLTLPTNRPLYALVTDPVLSVLAVAAATLLPALAGLVVTRLVLRRLDRDPEHPVAGQVAYGRGMLAIQFLLAVGHAGVLAGTQWIPLCNSLPVIGDWPVLPGFLSITPFLIAIVLAWAAVYPADRAVRQIALEIYLLRGRPTRPVWPRLEFIVYQLRHQVLFVLVPMLLILAAADLASIYRKPLAAWSGLEHAPDLLVGLVAVLVALFTPELLRHIWLTQRLPPGPLRDKLLVLARHLRLRCRDILIWRSGGHIVNAAVMGVVPPLRYVLITDGMLEQMEDTKIEAVFGHEAGHVKRHHIFFFLVFAFISGCIVTIFTQRTQALGRSAPETYEQLLTALIVGLGVKWLLVFGWLSRTFERQADIFGVQALTRSGLPCGQPCALHGNGAEVLRPNPLCSTAASVFSDALHEVAVLNGIRPEARGFRHPSIAARSRFLQVLAQDPPRAARFERVALVAKTLIFVAAVVCGAWAAAELSLFNALGRLLAGSAG